MNFYTNNDLCFYISFYALYSYHIKKYSSVIFITRLCLESVNLCQGENANQKWYGSLIQTSSLLWIRIRTSVLDSLPCLRQSFCQWHLSQAPPKQSAVFHLHNTSVTRELSVYLDGQRLCDECHPTYLGVTLDRKLSYREHLAKTAGKLKNRSNLLMKLAGSTWGASANTLRSSAPVWSCSAHTSQVDVQLNSTMRLISGTLHSTGLPWLPVLSSIEPPAIWRKAATDKLVEKIVKHNSWPIQEDILNPLLLWLTSRKPLWLDLQPVNIKGQLRWSILR